MEVLYQSSAILRLAINVEGSSRDADIVDGTHQVTITITRNSDNTVIVDASNVEHETTGLYKYVLDPNDNLTLGKFKVVWNYQIDGEVFPRTQYYDVVVPYTNAADLKAEYPELDSKQDSEIYRKEKLARRIINTFCKQSFDFETGVAKKIEGTDSQKLLLPKRIYNLTSVVDDEGTDFTSEVEIYTDYHLRRKDIDTEYDERTNVLGIPYFHERVYYYITGDWGWPYVPEEIQRATNLLIKDYFTDDSLLRQHGIFQATIGDEQYYFNNDLWNTTGNYDVDILISNYTNFNITVF